MPGDNFDITAGAGTPIATNFLTIGGSNVHVQTLRLSAGKHGEHVGEVGGANVDGDANRAALYVQERSSTVRITPTVTVSLTAYATDDSIGGVIEIPNAARHAGDTISIDNFNIVDTDGQLQFFSCWFFRDAVTVADNALWTPTAAHGAKLITQISASSYDIQGKRVCIGGGYNGMFTSLVATSLYLLIKADAAVTFTHTNALNLSIDIMQL